MPRRRSSGAISKEFVMQDVIFLVGGIGFFLLSIGYAVVCDQL